MNVMDLTHSAGYDIQREEHARGGGRIWQGPPLNGFRSEKRIYYLVKYIDVVQVIRLRLRLS